MTDCGYHLPEELMFDILLRLPVKSLLRFKCVRKSWRSLLRNPSFVTKHQNHDRRDEFLLLRYFAYDLGGKWSYSSLSYETLDVLQNIDFRDHIEFDRGYCFLDIVACCDGIVCFQVRSSREIFLWNPATRQLRKLMRVPRSNHDYGVCNYGFGYDVKGNDYKVIQLPNSNNTTPICDATVPIASYSREAAYKVYTDGIYSWFVRDKHHSRIIVSFDMSKEVFITRELPDYLEIVFGASLIALNKRIAMYICSVPYNNDGEIFLLNDYGVKESWTKLYTLGSKFYNFTPMSFWKNGDIFAVNSGEVILFNPETEETKRRPQLDSLRMKYPWIWFYKESLVPII